MAMWNCNSSLCLHGAICLAQVGRDVEEAHLQFLRACIGQLIHVHMCYAMLYSAMKRCYSITSTLLSRICFALAMRRTALKMM
jgi:hypothetical protein